MLEHQKKVLKSVSFDKTLFRKELIKSLSWLNNKEQIQLAKWVRENFAHLHANIIMDVCHPKYDYAS